MKKPYIFSNEIYFNTLKSQIGGGVIPVFVGSRQRGGGIGSVLSGIAKYAIPLISRYILPHAKSAAYQTLKDITDRNISLKKSLKAQGPTFLNNISSDILASTNQSGKGILSRKRTSKFAGSPLETVVLNKKKKPTPKKRKLTKRNKRDIFT